MKSEKHALAGLDALRGLAILGVIVAHFFGAYIPALVEQICAAGGVMLFFLLSGFLIDRTFNKEPDVLGYLIRRILRIWPMYAITVLLIAASDDKWTNADLAQNLIFSASNPNVMSGVFWTLYVETLFYLLAPLTILSGNLGLVAAPILVIARFAYGLAFDAPASPMWFFLTFCFLGLQAGAAYRGALRMDVAVTSIIVVGFAAGFLSLGSWQTPLTFACALALFAALKFNPEIRILSFFGEASYSWYLLHSVFGYTIGWMAVAHTGVSAPVGMAIGALVSLLVSYASFRLIEKPCIDASKSLVEFKARHKSSQLTR